MAEAKKDTVYVDVDDEITVIIDKVRSSSAKIVALVLPKRATTLQSVVNLKLLKRTAKDAKKSVVLITSEQNIVALAAGVGLHVAKTLQSKPELPEMKIVDNSSNTSDAPAIAAPAAKVEPAAEDTIEIDNELEAIDLEDKKVVKADTGKKKLIKIPNFDRFRLLLFGGIALVLLLIVGSIFAFVVMPKADIIITTDSSSQTIDMNNLIAKKDATLDEDSKTMGLLTKELKKTETEKVPATGQRDDGEKATGTITITNCNKEADDGITLPAGSVLSTSANGTALAFVTTEPVSIPQSDFTGSGVCKNTSFKNVAVVAQSAGTQYNLSAHKSFTTNISGVSGTDSSAMSGGTTKLTQVVSQTDIDNAKQRVLDRVSQTATNDLKAQFATDNAIALTDTIKASEPVISSTPKLNETATDVTVQAVITYTGAGVKKDDLKQLVEAEANKNIDSSRQTIQDNGLDDAVLRITDNKAPNQVNFSLQTIVVAGPTLDSEGIKKEIAGKGKSETDKIIKGRPGIKDVDVNYKPFWVFSTPKSTKKITITFKQPDANQ